ncbi:extensin family protein [Blastochloris viridis]|nr:extensin family protein [Blastochloris viridis]
MRTVTGFALALALGSSGAALAQGSAHIEIVPPLPLHKAVFSFSTLPVETGLPVDIAAAGVVPLPPQHALSPWSIAGAPPKPVTALGAIAAVVPLPPRRPTLPPAGLALTSVGVQPADLGVPRNLPASPDGHCRNVFALGYAVAKPVPPVKGVGTCGAAEVVELSAVVLADGSRVAIEPAATLNCRMAEGLSRWVREDLAPSAARVGHPFKALKNFASYDCRGRNRNPLAKMSEHGHANAIDIRGFESRDGQWRFIDNPDMPQALLTEMKRGACERFMTVLGPGSDGYHENHIHVDLAERASGRRLCSWRMDEPVVAQSPRSAKPADLARTLIPVQPRPPAPPSPSRPVETGEDAPTPSLAEVPADTPERAGFAEPPAPSLRGGQ